VFDDEVESTSSTGRKGKQNFLNPDYGIDQFCWLKKEAELPESKP
jgi:hypothetical protein